MKTKPVTPYARLLADIREWTVKVAYRHTVCMWRYPKDTLATGWSLVDLKERTLAARQLGYEVHVVINDAGDVQINYVKELPAVPYEWQ